MYIVYTEQKTGKVARHYLSTTLTRTKQLVGKVQLKYPDRAAGYRELRKGA